jgi:hypothetical protein
MSMLARASARRPPYAPGRIGAWMLLLAPLAIGCGPEQPVDPNRTTVSGTVSFNGQPLKAGTITFDSTEKQLSTSVPIGTDGRYATNRMPIGANIVTIETEMLKHGSPHLYVKIPAKYANPVSSGLAVEIKQGVNENVNFELKP